MKWFKTKKDKRIAELEAEVERKNKAIEERDRAMLWSGGYSVRQMKSQTLKFAKRCFIRYGEDIDVETALAVWKTDMTEEIAKYIFPNVVWRFNDCGGDGLGNHAYELYGRVVVMKEDDDGV